MIRCSTRPFMHLLSVNVGERRTITRDGKTHPTGIYKLPVSGPVAVTHEGLAGDVIVATKHHGGPDQAIYVYGEPDYAWWAQELGRELDPGEFGENLTIAGFESATARVGDRLHIGAAVVLEITSPRVPCANFAARMEDARFSQRFRAAERPGVYCRVIQAGAVQAGDAVRGEATTGATVSVIEMYRDYYDPQKTREAIHRFLSAPIAVRSRKDKERQLRELTMESRGHSDQAFRSDAP